MFHTLGAFILIQRQQRGWSLRVLAKKSGLSNGAISRIENGNDPQLSSLAAIAKAFDFEVGDLLVAAGYTHGRAIEDDFNGAKILAMQMLARAMRDMKKTD